MADETHQSGARPRTTSSQKSSSGTTIFFLFVLLIYQPTDAQRFYNRMSFPLENPGKKLKRKINGDPE